TSEWSAPVRKITHPKIGVPIKCAAANGPVAGPHIDDDIAVEHATSTNCRPSRWLVVINQRSGRNLCNVGVHNLASGLGEKRCAVLHDMDWSSSPILSRCLGRARTQPKGQPCNSREFDG